MSDNAAERRRREVGHCKRARATPAETSRGDTTVPVTTYGTRRAGYRTRASPAQRPAGLNP